MLQPQQMVNTIAPPPGGIQIVQQIIGANGEIQVNFVVVLPI
jgi:hypothetical protein